MNDYFIEDYKFDLAVQDDHATQTDIDNFMNDLANEFDAKWSPETGGYRLIGITNDAYIAYIELKQSIDDRIADMTIGG